MPDQKNMEISGDKNVADGRQGNDSRFEATENKFTQCKQNSRKGELRITSGCISHKSERLGIEQ